MRADPFQLTGTTIDGRYRIDAVIGEGGFGVVYRAFHLGFQAPIAVKVLKVPAELKPEDRARFLETFDAEGNLLFQLAKRHPAFVQVTEKGVIHGAAGPLAPYLVLEWLDGEPLESDLERRAAENKGGRRLDEVIGCLTPIAEALGIAHAQKVAHRDIKPANIFLARGPDGVSSKLLDFGIAKVMTATGSAALRDPTMKGFGGFTMQYGAPEQWNRKYGATGPWTDVYALALVAVEMLIGEPALQGDEPGQFFGATIDPHDRPTPSARGAAVFASVEDVFRKALAVAPGERYRDAKAFWEALLGAQRAAVAGAGPGQTIKGPTIVTPMPPPSLKTTPMPPIHVPPPPEPKKPRSPAVLLSVAAVGLLVPLGLLVATGMSNKGTGGDKADASASSVASSTPAPVPVPTTQTPPVASVSCPAGMAPIPAGTFTMGSKEYDEDERPPHPVSVGAFCVDLTEVTVAAFSACVAKGMCKEAGAWDSCNGTRSYLQDHPVNCVDWGQADTYCRAQVPAKRLITEEEWEYAARGGSEQRLYPWGDKAPASQLCWNGTGNDRREKDWARTCRSGSYTAGDSRWGLHDMAGNVWEWTDTWYCPNYASKDCAKEKRVFRGGAWSGSSPLSMRASDRGKGAPAVSYDDVGFRCARTAQ
jgi:formylglycine-generating enzyme required for sulfatase activity